MEKESPAVILARLQVGLPMKPKRSKYNVGPKEERTADNIVFASKREMNRYLQLKGLQRAGVISDLVLQPRFPIVINGYKICVVVPDFEYVSIEDGSFATEDAKGVRTPVYVIKAKLFEACYAPRRIIEV